MRKAKGIKGWIDQMERKKKPKSFTTFQNASDAINTATSGGKSCNGGLIPADAKTVDETLQNCNTTASQLCNSSDISVLGITLVNECFPKLLSYVDAYKVKSKMTNIQFSKIF